MARAVVQFAGLPDIESIGVATPLSTETEVISRVGQGPAYIVGFEGELALYG